MCAPVSRDPAALPDPAADAGEPKTRPVARLSERPSTGPVEVPVPAGQRAEPARRQEELAPAG